ncbi:MAG: CcoQ/FixQ family Cbb3-type cytochrome c oxidase assembly chaperone [Bacteroidota bacterium]
MLRDIFKSVGGIESYGLISMIIFLVFFALLLLHTFSLKKNDVEDFSRMPLDDFSKKSDDIQDI